MALLATRTQRRFEFLVLHIHFSIFHLLRYFHNLDLNYFLLLFYFLEFDYLVFVFLLIFLLLLLLILDMILLLFRNRHNSKVSLAFNKRIPAKCDSSRHPKTRISFKAMPTLKVVSSYWSRPKFPDPNRQNSYWLILNLASIFYTLKRVISRRSLFIARLSMS